jgi:predicted SnoaL-like aldol condensation-catalyzing enzyme
MHEQEASKVVVRRFIEELWNRGDFNRIDQIVAPNFVMHDPTGAGSLTGPAAIRKEFETERSNYPGGHFQLDEMIAEGDLVACRTTYRVLSKTPAGPDRDPARKSTLRGMNFFRVSKGRITEEWWVYDPSER